MSSIPTHSVTQVSLQGKAPVMSDVAQVMRADAEHGGHRNERQGEIPPYDPTRQVMDDPIRYNAVGNDPNGRIVTNGAVAGHAIDSDEAQQIVKKINTQADLKISRLGEIAAYLKWGTLGLMTLTFGAWTAAATGGAGSFLAGLGSMTAATAIGAFASGPFLGLLAASLVVGGTSLLMMQSARKLQSERWMDVQGFMQERTAVKVGKQVAQAVVQEPQQTTPQQGTRWQETVRMSQAEAQAVNEGRSA